MRETNDENVTTRSKTKFDGLDSTPSTRSDNEADPTIRQLLDEIKATREDMASIRSDNERLRSTVEGLTPLSANPKQTTAHTQNRFNNVTPVNLFNSNVSLVDEGHTSKQQSKQPMNHPVRRTPNPIGPLPGYERLQTEPQVTEVQI